MSENSKKLKGVMKNGKPVARLKDPKPKADCFLDGGCHKSTMDKACPGIPTSNKCAACAHKKILFGIDPYHLA